MGKRNIVSIDYNYFQSFHIQQCMPKQILLKQTDVLPSLYFLWISTHFCPWWKNNIPAGVSNLLFKSIWVTYLTVPVCYLFHFHQLGAELSTLTVLCIHFFDPWKTNKKGKLGAMWSSKMIKQNESELAVWANYSIPLYFIVSSITKMTISLELMGFSA